MRGVKRLGLVIALVTMGLAPAGAAEGAAQPSDQDRKFLTAIHQVNLFEIAAGDLAEQQAANQQVKDLAARFVTDHTQLDQTVQSTATTAGVTLPGAPNKEQKAVADKLKGLSGEEFDRQWVAAQLTGHQQAIQLTDTEIAKGSDAAVKQLAQDAKPVLQAHHDALVALAQQLGVPVPSPSATTGAPSPTTPGPTTPGPTTPGPTGTGSPGPTGSPAPTGTGAPTETTAPSPAGS